MTYSLAILAMGIVVGICFTLSAFCLFNNALGKVRRDNAAYRYFVSEVHRLVSDDESDDDDWLLLIGRYLRLLDYVFIPADDEAELGEG